MYVFISTTRSNKSKRRTTMETNPYIAEKTQESSSGQRCSNVIRAEMLRHDPEYNYKFLLYLSFYINVANVIYLVC